MIKVGRTQLSGSARLTERPSEVPPAESVELSTHGCGLGLVYQKANVYVVGLVWVVQAVAGIA